ncbi:MAG: RHS repeat-associated core domain-containing protein [Chloroflexi bacterium]|nr:RHS repeat-associated core domain-containing protein [Chloroflexota bacterium]
MYGYTGELTDANELVYLRNRYYHPGVGTFISQDPYEGTMNNPVSLNRYSYVQGNPVNVTDPSGMIPVQAINHMMQSNPLAIAQMMNIGVCFAQNDPCAEYAGQAYIYCRRGLFPTNTPTPFPGTPTPATYHVQCDFAFPFLNVRREPSVLAGIVLSINNPAGVELQLSSFIPGDTHLGGFGWWYVSSFGGWVHDSNLTFGPSPCPRPVVTPSPTPTVPGPTPTPGTSDLDTISRVINCEAAGVGVSAYGIAHSIYNRMTSGATEWASYRSALSIIQNTGVDCYPSAYRNYPTSNESNRAAQWLLGIGTAPIVDNVLIDLRAYYWLGVPTFPNLSDSGQVKEATINYIADNPGLYNAGACGVSETRDTRLQRLRDRIVGIDPSDGDLTTIYFSLSPLCP